MRINNVSKIFASSLLATCISASLPAQASGFHTQNGGATGGQNGQVVRATTGKQIHEALCNRNTSETPIIIEVEGVINHGNTEKVSGASCNTAEDKIELKDIANVTLIGVGNGALFDQLGIHIRNSSNIIIRNVHVRNVKKSGSPISNGGDAIGIETDVRNVWVDHVTLEASGGESSGYDGLFDVKDNSKYITLSYSILRNSGRGGLVGSSESQVNNGPLTYHHNIFENLDSRVPLVRGATAHIYNNYYDGINSSGINSRAGAEVKVENNYFENAKDVLGTFYTTTDGDWQVSGNIFGSGVTWSSSDSDYEPAGPNVVSTTSVSIPYSYTLDNTSCIRDILAQTAGANKGLATSDGSCGTTGGGSTGGGSTGGGSTGGGSTGGGTSSGTNLSIGAGADGSSKASGSSYANVIDGSTSTYWSPSGTTGRISVKNLNTTINAVRIVELPGSEGSVTSWRLVDHSNGSTITSGNTIPDPITFSDINISKINFFIDSASSTPKIAEFETYNGLDSNGGDSSGGSGGSSGGEPSGPNLSLNADSDGSSKASGTSYGSVRDGDTSTYWSPSSSTGRISIKNLNTTVSAVRIIEASSAQGNVTSWRLVNHDTGSQLASGNNLQNTISFSPVNLNKISLYIDSSSGTPRIAEFETY